MFEYKEQQLFLDYVRLESADVRVDLFEEQCLLRVGHGVRALELNQCLVQFNCVLILFDLRELVLL